MKKIVLFMSLGIMLVGGMFHIPLQAQVSMTIPNGGFEQWSSHSGYSVTVLFVPISVYNSYSTPSTWNYLIYPVNETVSLMGMNVNINTSVPIVKTTQETGVVPEGSKAVKLHTIMLEDIVSSTVLSVAGSYLDPSLSQQVIPSVLLTGEVDIDAFIPLLSDLMSGSGDIFSMLPALLSEDVNDYITGGLALDGFRPGRLTGSYKYHSAVGGDNGGVMMLGTRYNNATHRREIVGAGFNISLVDTGAYTPFEVEYLPLGELVPGSPNREPDSLIVMLFSSASMNMQQGSYLCLDNLMLWPAPDTCADITALAAVPQIHETTLNWSIADSADSFEIEYGPVGFPLGSGNTATSAVTSLVLNGLDAGTTYDAYVRTICSDSVYGEWSNVQFTTYTDTCASVLDLMMQNTVYDAPPEMVLTWHGSSLPDRWEVEYGPQGFALGTGITVETAEPYFEIYPLERNHTLSPNTWYDFYVRSVCGNDVYGDWDSVHYLTPCAEVSALVVKGDNTSVTADNLISGYSVSWTDNTDTRRWSVYYGIYSSEFPDSWGTYVMVDTPYFEFPPLVPERRYTVEVTALCAEDNYGEPEMVSFDTPAIVGIETADAVTLTVSPNPAHEQCEVSLSDNRPVELELYSLDGRLLQTLSTDGQTVTLCLPSQGVFLLRASTSLGTTTQKIVSR